MFKHIIITRSGGGGGGVGDLIIYILSKMLLFGDVLFFDSPFRSTFARAVSFN